MADIAILPQLRFVENWSVAGANVFHCSCDDGTVHRWDVGKKRDEPGIGDDDD